MKTIVAVVFAGFVMISPSAAATEVGVADLMTAPEVFDGEEITLTGELVGDFQRRGEAVWVQLNDDPYVTAPLHDGGAPAGGNLGVAVRFPTRVFEAAGFTAPGGYRVRGPVVRVTGEWRFHDPERGGETYLAAAFFEVIERERPITQGGDWPVFLIGLALVIAGLVPRLAKRRARRQAL